MHNGCQSANHVEIFTLIYLLLGLINTMCKSIRRLADQRIE
jgi:hypothetical protein